MKPIHKVTIGVGAVLGTILLGVVWVTHTAIDIVADTVDTTVDAAKSVESIAQANHDNTQQAKRAASQDADQQKASRVQEETSADKSAAGVKVAGKSQAQTHDAAKGGDDADDDLIGSLTQIAGPLLDDGDGEPWNVPALMRSFDKSDNDEDWLSLVPGGNSPTLKRWHEGKYKGHEDQAIEDAIYDPQAWRLVSFFGGL